MSIVNTLEARLPALRQLRQTLHATPELGFAEHRTGDLIAGELERLGIPYHRGIGKTGLVGVIEGRRQTRGRAIGLRADMDALPLHEQTQLPYASCCPGRMHACGHDGHVTMLLAAAAYLSETRAFDGTVYLVFQPGEEGYAGAREMVEDGLFERFPVEQVYALHNWPTLPLGTLSIAPGPAMAATDRIEIEVFGVGGHGGVSPHKCVDPVLVAAHVITAVQSIVSRNVPALDAAVISLCAIQGGQMDGFAVIPDSVKIVGTARSLTAAMQTLLETRLHEVVRGVATAFGARATVTYERLFPMTVNDPEVAAFATDVAVELFGREQVVARPQPSLGGEDFAFMLQRRPGAYVHFGTGSPGGGDHGLHSPHFDFNDAAIPLGGAYLARLAERALPMA